MTVIVDLETRDGSKEHQQKVYCPDVDTSGVDEKKLMRRVDWHVIPWLALLYLLNFLDRGSIGNAKLYNMEKDLGINDNQYLIALTLFFFPYSLFEPASNVMLRRLKPSIWLSTMIVLWGIVMMLHGFIHNYGGLVTLRLLLGLTEAGMYPGIVFYITSWYKRSEMGTKVALFFSSATVAGAFSGLLAAAIANMDGIGGKTGWAWIFILEGIATIIVGIISYFVIQDFPDNAKFLSEEERVFIIRRLQTDMKFSAAGEQFHFKYVWRSLRDWKTWVAMAIYMGFDGPLYAFSLFTPSIINQLGFTATKANLLSVPVYAWGCLITLVMGVYGDRWGKRCVINVSLFGVGLTGYIILIFSRVPALSYFAVFFAVSAIYPTIPNSVAWVASNVEGSYKRSVTLGMAIGFGNLNGAVTANIYRAGDQPWYPLGHGIVLAYIAIGFFSSLIFAFLLRRENRKRDRGERDEVIEGVDNKHAREYNGRYESVEAAKIDKGDEWSGFRYTI
ncbi:MFS general substrate transporter [Macrolepiota fuliginosa MF-IS2]|uniref:MFS general substrate transporter n=1 Tax=Macrolepiota fuliginosa MF-IS2 TaxID=1400762 RepID=A0A9P5XQD3_9AGAR|nr:MFS general substrate transporter [Macrolepiota fuliginosa MF-IS2]